MSSLEIAKLDLMYVGIIIFTGLLAGVIAKKIKVPDIVVFLLVRHRFGASGKQPVACTGRFHHEPVNLDHRRLLFVV